MKMVAIANPKGGTGNTETSIFLGHELARRGYKVLLLDLSTLHDMFDRLLHYTPLQETIGFDFNKKDTYFEKAIYDVNENLDIAKCSLCFINKVFSEYINTGNCNGYRDIFKCIEDDYDYCIADLNSSYDAFFISSVLAADSLIIPVTIEEDNRNSFSVLNYICSFFKSKDYSCYNPNFRVAGILVTRWLEDLEHDKDILMKNTAYAQLLETKIYKTKIRHSWYVKEAKQNGIFLGNYAPNATVTKDYINFVEEFLEDEQKYNDVNSDENNDENDNENIAKTSEASVLDERNKARKVSLCISLSKEQNVAIVTLSVKIGVSYTEMVTRILKKGFELVAQNKGFEYRNSSKIYLTKPVWVPKDIKDQLENMSREERLDKTYIIRCLIDLVIETNAF